MNSDPQTKAYVQRRTKEGLSKTEIVRCLKRYVARETYALLPRELLTDSRSITHRTPASRHERTFACRMSML